jgi:hypothetical protein
MMKKMVVVLVVVITTIFEQCAFKGFISIFSLEHQNPPPQLC